MKTLYVKLISTLLFCFLLTLAFAQTPVKIKFGNDSIMVSPVDNGNSEWGGYAIVTNALSTTDGQSNTSKIINIVGINGGAVYSAIICDTLILNNFDDWYLPSKEELNAIYLNKTSIGGVFATLYWSSSEVNDYNAWSQYFDSGIQNYNVKYTGSSVRCIRKNKSLAITDADGNTYNTVKIGTQTWMKENLKTTKYNNGDQIATTIPATLDLTAEINPNYQWAYDGNNTNATMYGRLYTWYAITDNRGVCPIGFHIPSENDWTILSNFMGGLSIAGGKLKEKGTLHWQSPNTNATDSMGFSALPGGFRTNSGTFMSKFTNANFFSFDEMSINNAGRRGLSYDGSNLNTASYSKEYALSIRCLRNDTDPTIAGFTIKTDSISKKVILTNNAYSYTNTFWQLGNATVSSETNPIATYNKGGYYRIVQFVIDTSTNNIDQIEKVIQINDGTSDCEAEFTYVANTTDKFVAFTNVSLGTNLTTYVWDFGDKQTSTMASPSHTFAADNYYNVCLTIANATCKNISCKTLKTGVDATKENTAFVYVSNKNSNNVYFNDKSTAATKWIWTFGDGTTSTTQHPQHIYADTGLYHVTLEINTATDASQIYSALVNVHSNIHSLRATFISKEKATPTKGVLPIEFKGAGYGDANEVEWDFGDGTTSSTSMYPIHEYAQPGKYKVCMTVYDSLAYETFTYCDSVEIGLVGINHASLTINHLAFDMYPNPASQSITIQAQRHKGMVRQGSPQAPAQSEIQITNTLGQTVFSQQLNNSSPQQLNIDISQYQSGMYFVRVGNTIKKLIITK